MVNKLKEMSRTFLTANISWKTWLPFFCVFLLPMPYLFGDLIYLNYADMYLYLRKALEMGAGQVELFIIQDRTALFPFILHVLFELFGYSVFSMKAFYVFIFSVLSVQAWIMCRVFVGNNSGVISSLFIASSFLFGHFAYFPHIDLLLVVCLNFCLLVLYRAVCVHTNRFRWIFLSGLCIGLTYTLKQTAIVLLIFFPVYLLFVERVSFLKIIKLWMMQLLGLSVILIPIIILSYPDCFAYAFGYMKAIRQPEGAEEFSRDLSVVRILTYFFNPVLWQWDEILPYNVFMVGFDQAIALLSFVLLLTWTDVKKETKAVFLIAVLIFLPWYVHVAYKGHKLRQLLFPEFLMFVTVGPVVHNVLTRMLRTRVSTKSWLHLTVMMGLLLCVIYGVRTYFVDRDIQKNVVYARTQGWLRAFPSKVRLVGKQYLDIPGARIRKIRRANRRPAGSLEPRVRIKESHLGFGFVSRNQLQTLKADGKIPTRTVTVVLEGGDNLKIAQVEVEKSLFEITAVKIDPNGQTAIISIVPVLEKLQKNYNGDRIRIHTNQKGYEVLSLAISIIILDNG